MLLQSVQDKDEKVALLSLQYIQKIDDPKIYLELTKKILNMQGLAFELAVVLLQEKEAKGLIPLLKEIYFSKDKERRNFALKSIAKVQPSFIHSQFNKLKKDKNIRTQGTAIEAYLKTYQTITSTNPAYKSLHKLLTSNKKKHVLEALRIIQEIPHTSFASLLLKVKLKKNKEIKKTLHQCMAKLPDLKITKFLIEELKTNKIENSLENSLENNYFINTALIKQKKYSLELIHKELDKILELKNQKEYFIIMKSFIYCLGEIGSLQSIDLLNKILKNRYSHHTKIAIQALLKISEKQKMLSKKRNDSSIFPPFINANILQKIYDNYSLIQNIPYYIFLPKSHSK